MTMNSSTIEEKLNLQQLILNIKNLNEQSDQSREQCMIANFIDQSKNSISIKPNQSIITMIKQTKGLQLGEICRKKAESSWVNANQIHEISELKETNKKLIEDNKALVRECVRLRIALKNKQYNDGKELPSVNSLEVLNMEYLNEINKLRTQNLQLKLVQLIPILNVQLNKEIQLLYTCVEEIKENSSRLSYKIQEVKEKDKTNKLSRSNTTTSRTDDHNIKVAYESQIKILKDQVQTQKQQIIRLRRLSNSLHHNHISPHTVKPI